MPGRLAAAVLSVAVPLALALVPIAPAHAAGEQVSVWLTTPNLSQRLTPVAPVRFAPATGTAPRTISINEGRRFQRIFGFGATFTDSSAWLTYTKLSPAQRGTLLRDVFGTATPNSIGLNFLRQPIGGNDYVKDLRGYYTFDDLPPGQTDPTLSRFSVAHDEAYLLPVLREALAVNPELRVKLASWTAPAWMKSNNSLINGGDLLPQYYGTYARYLVRSVQAYEERGVPVHAVSVQNEPSIPTGYPSMTVSAPQSADILRNHLAPALASARLQTEIWAGDDVFFDTAYPNTVLSDPVAGEESPATSMHGYLGDIRNLARMHDLFPYKAVHQTELSPGCQYRSAIDLFINATRNFAETAVTWNVTLDPQGGPFHTGPSSTCTPLAVIDPATGAVTYTDAYYQSGHLSKFVPRGSVRIDSTDLGDVPNVAFRTPDGSKVLVAWNNQNESRAFRVRWGDQAFDYTLAAGAIATFRWAGTTTGDPQGWGDASFVDPFNPYGGGGASTQYRVINRRDLDQNGLGFGWNSTFLDYADLQDYTFTSTLRRGTAGTFGNPKYGVYACYRDVYNYSQIWLEPRTNRLLTHVVEGGNDRGYVPSALPAGFDFDADHTLAVQKAGTTYAVRLNGQQVTSFTASLGNCQVGLVTEDHTARYRAVDVQDPLRFGDSRLGADPFNGYGGGLQSGQWSVQSPASVNQRSLGYGWSSLFRGYLRPDQTVSVDVRAIRPGTYSLYPKYGVYGAYRDGGNYVQAWIDPTSRNFVTKAVAGGTDLGWNNIPLPAGFDASAYHTIRVTRVGNTFTFFLDGVQQQVRTAAVGAAQAGLVTEDHQANFRRFTIT